MSKKGSKKAKATKREAVKPSEVREQISVGKLKSLMGMAHKVYKNVRSMAGDFGIEIKNAVEHDHLHRKAFAAVKAADRMEPEALADFFDARDFYEDVLGLRKRAEQAPRLPMSGNDDVDNVRQFPPPAGIAAE